MRNAGLEEAQTGIKIARRNINNLRYVDDTTLMAESEEELKSLLMKVKEESKKVGLRAPREAESQPGTDPSPGLAQEWLGPTAPRGPFPDTLHCQDPKPEIFVRARPNQTGVDCPANRRELSLEPVTVYLEKSKKSDVSCT